MKQEREKSRFPTMGDGSGLEPTETFYREELQLASRNRGMPLEALQYDITPTGMHYLLVHFDIPKTDARKWQLQIGGLVSRPLTLSLADIRRRAAVSQAVTMECAGNGRALLNPRPLSQPWLVEAVGTARWTGTPLKGLLEEAGIDNRAVDVVFTGADRGVQGEEVQDYQRSLSVPEVMRDEVLLAYEMNGQPLEPQHGYPLRLLVPGWYGMTSVKWLSRIEVIGEPFQGYQMVNAYRYSVSEDEVGEPVDLIRVRALMVPPGIPDFATRIRLVKAGDIQLSGRAWAGRRQVSSVDVSTDGGGSWSKARLGEPVDRYAWRPWSFSWHAAPGRYTLAVRASDSEGNTQPFDPVWTQQGMGNNMAQRVDVIVE